MTTEMPLLGAADIRAFLARNGLATPAELPVLEPDRLSRLDLGGANAFDAMSGLLAHRRLYNLGHDIDLSERMLRQGLVSAAQIAAMPRRTFVQEHADGLGLSPDEAEKLHRRAVRIQNKTMHLWAAVHGTVSSPHFRATRVSNVGDDVHAHFENLPSYQEMFGSLDFCGCPECKSIFGPAAYFVDLMRIVDTYITKPNAKTIPAAFVLDARRPDLAQIPLTCEKTNTTVPYLQIINERLIAAARTALGLTDDQAVLQKLATDLRYPLNVPMNDPLERIRALLLQLGVSLADLFSAWGGAAADVARESLGLSVEQAAILSTAETDPAKLAAYFDVTDLTQLTSLRLLADRTGLAVPDAQDLITQGLSDAEIGAKVPKNLFINQGLGDSFLAIKADADAGLTVANLTNPALDQINRLLRLSAALGWTAPVTDWVLRAVSGGAAPAITPAVLPSVLRAKRLTDQFQLTPVQAATLFGPIKTYGGDGAGGATPFDQLFNDPATVGKSGPYHPSGNPLSSLYQDKVLTWQPGAAADLPAIMRVAPGLGLKLDALTALGQSLFGSASQNLTVDVLSALYRHALLSRCMGLPMERYLLLLDLAGLTGKVVFAGADVDRLLALWQWLTDNELDVYQMLYVLTGTKSVYVNPLLDESQVQPWAVSLGSLVPATADDAADRVAAQIAVFFSVDRATLDPALAMALAAVPLPAGVTQWFQAFLAPLKAGAPPYLDYITGVLRRVARWLAFVQAASITPDVLACAARNPASFGLPADFGTLTFDPLRSIQQLTTFITRFGDRRGDFIRYIDLSAQSKPATDPLDALHSATGWPSDQVALLLAQEVQGVANAVDRISRLAACFDQMTALGSDVTFMRGVAALAPTPATQWTAYTSQADLVLAKVSNRFGPDRWSSVSGQVEGKLQVRRRDALLGVVLASLRAQYDDIRTPDNVYEFLLTDVQTGPEAQISYVKEALNAVQLYLQRCRLRLEPGVDVLDIPEAWWDWILNYRMWEANRQIFLYPENYLLPSVRSDKTALFKQLENDLQQSEVTPEYVESAYTTYIENLCSLADLRPVEAFYGEINDPRQGKVNALYLFAVSRTAPGTFYMCRRLTGNPWSEWEKIDLSINSPYVTAVYAFGRLFLFWARLEKTSSPSIDVGTQGGQTSTNISYRATIQYSFQNRAGKWVQPQTLVQDQTVCFLGQGKDAVPLMTNPVFDGVFDMEQVPWQRVFALHVTADHLAPGMPLSADGERIVILYGPYLNNVPASTDLSAVAAPANPEPAAFAALVADRVKTHDHLLSELISGQIPFSRGYVLDSSLRISVLSYKAENVLVDPYQPAAPLVQFRPELNDLTDAVQMVTSASPLSDNYMGDLPDLADVPAQGRQIGPADFVSEVVTPAQAQQLYIALQTAKVIDGQGNIDPNGLKSLNLYSALSGLLSGNQLWPLQLLAIQSVLLKNIGGPVLFAAIESQRARLITVKNQPGWFLLDSGDETFLLRPAPDAAEQNKPPVFSTLSGGLIVAPPPLHAASFILGGSTPIAYSLSKQIFDTLSTYRILDAYGNIRRMPEMDDLKSMLDNQHLTDGQLKAVRRVLLNYPVIFEDAFVSDHISLDLSKQIYALLQQYGLVNPSRRLALDILTGDTLAAVLDNLLLSGQLKQRDLTAIYRTLVSTPVPVSLSYVNQGQPADFASAPGFGVTRLSTSAVPALERALFTGGIERMLSLPTQNVPAVPVLPFDRLQPAGLVAYPDAVDGAQVDFDGLYGQYFWELFFHGPMLVANGLAANQQFRDALTWFHYVFDPTVPVHPITPNTFADETGQVIDLALSGQILEQLQSHSIGTPPAPIVSADGQVNPAFTATTDLTFLSNVDDDQRLMVRNILLNYKLATPASRFWNFRPFRTHTLEKLPEMLADTNPAVQAYNNNPFDPFAIARLRIGAFEKATVMQYIDTLIQWGDFYFAQDTWESITAASMLYVYASDLLGPRPQQVGNCSAEPATLADIRKKYASQPGGIPQFLIYLESTLEVPSDETTDPVAVQAHGFNDLGTYFCVPENDVFLGYWDRVADRLNKIRHSLNIQGQFRALALFEPPMDPMALIRAAGASNNLVPANPAGQGAVPPFRFRYTLDRARNLAASVAQQGSEFLAALEKKDAEGLALLRNTQEAQVLALTTQIKQAQIDELQYTLDSLKAAQAGAQARLDHYTTLIKNGLSASENTNLDAMAASLVFNITASVLQAASAIGYAIPQVGSPFAMTYGGIQLGSAVQAAAAAAQVGGEISNYVGQRALTMSGYERRAEEWSIQQAMAQHDVDSLASQISATQSRLAAAKQDLVVQQKTIAQNKALDDFLRGKFTSQDLYIWMIGRMSALYFQTYRLAVEAALSAQVAFQYELDRTDSFLDLENWDSLRKGLLAGEGLRQALDRMEAAYVDGSTRTLEIERTLSLAELAPAALQDLKTKGVCSFDLPELLFDYDFPGHYARKIKAISLSIPAVVGPYQNVKATLTQTKNALATDASIAAVRYLIDSTQEAPASVRVNWANNQMVAISKGVDDSGLFVLDFHDERYLPFEGTGAVSSWTLEMPPETNRFDFSQLSDVIITLRYTARADGTLKSQVQAELAKRPLTVGYYVDVARSYPLEWQAFMQNHSDPNSQALTFTFTPNWQGALKSLVLNQVLLRLTADPSITWPAAVTVGSLSAGKQSLGPVALQNGVAPLTGLSLQREQFTGPWQLTLDLSSVRGNPQIQALLADGKWLDPTKLVNVELILQCAARVF